MDPRAARSLQVSLDPSDRRPPLQSSFNIRFTRIGSVTFLFNCQV
jgi:hypothetical protein